MNIELTTQELDIILTEMVDIVKYKYDDTHIIKKFTKQLLKYREDVDLRQNTINKKWQPILDSVFLT